MPEARVSMENSTARQHRTRTARTQERGADENTHRSLGRPGAAACVPGERLRPV